MTCTTADTYRQTIRIQCMWFEKLQCNQAYTLLVEFALFESALKCLLKRLHGQMTIKLTMMKV